MGYGSIIVALEPKGKAVIWIKNGANQSLGLADFNSHYQTDLTEDQVIEIHNDGMANGSARTIAFQTDSGAQLAAASYNDSEGIDDTFPIKESLTKLPVLHK